MTFKELKQGYPVYILDKEKLTVKQGKVVNTSFPRIDNQPTGRQMVVDITLEQNGKNAVYTMPEDAAVVYANNLVLSTEQNCLAVEVEKMKADAERVLATVETQKEIIEVADDLLAQLNPSFKEKKETEQRFEKIENRLDKLIQLMEHKNTL
jgi:hypothetical protein